MWFLILISIRSETAVVVPELNIFTLSCLSDSDWVLCEQDPGLCGTFLLPWSNRTWRKVVAFKKFTSGSSFCHMLRSRASVWPYSWAQRGKEAELRLVTCSSTAPDSSRVLLQPCSETHIHLLHVWNTSDSLLCSCLSEQKHEKHQKHGRNDAAVRWGRREHHCTQRWRPRASTSVHLLSFRCFCC